MMKRSFLHLFTMFAAATLGGCSDDKGSGNADAATDAAGDSVSETARLDGPDAPADGPDAGTDAVGDVRPNVDCAAVGCGAAVSFRVPDFIARFGADARLIDVTVCRGSVCADARVQLFPNGGTTVTPGDGGPARTGASLVNDNLGVTFDPETSPTGMARQEQVVLRIVTSTGRLLVDFRTQAPVEVFCPGGLSCGICETITVNLDSADGGQAVDANHPGSGGVCQ
jgi:hypothetical protein